MKPVLVLILLLTQAFPQCSYYSQVSSTYNCPATSYLSVFLTPLCQSQSRSPSPTIQSVNPCLQSTLRTYISSIVNNYNQSFDCLDASLASRALTGCMVEKGLCELKDEWVGYLQGVKAAIGSTNGIWGKVARDVNTIGWDVIQHFANREAQTDKDALHTEVVNYVVGANPVPEQICSRDATLAILTSLEGSFRTLVNGSQEPATTTNPQSIVSPIPTPSPTFLAPPNSCQNYTNTQISSQSTTISMSDCDNVLFQNVTINNNPNLRFRITSIGKLIFKNVTAENNTKLTFEIISVGGVTVIDTTVSNTNYYAYTGALFLLTSTSVNYDNFVVQGWKGGVPVIQLRDGSINIHNSEFRDVELDGQYSARSVVDVSRASIMMSYTNFINVTGEDSGAIALYDGSINIHGGTFASIKARRGGGLYLTRGSLAVSDTTFKDCSAYTGAAIYASYCSANLVHVTIRNCRSDNGNLQFLNSTVNVTDSDIVNNSANSYAGVSSSYGTTTVESSTFDSNSAPKASAIGGFVGSASLQHQNTFKNNGKDAVGFSYSTVEVDDTNQVEGGCGDHCSECKLDQKTLLPNCGKCQDGWQGDGCNEEILSGGGVAAWFIILIIVAFLGLAVAGYFIYKRFKARQSGRYNQIA